MEVERERAKQRMSMGGQGVEPVPHLDTGKATDPVEPVPQGQSDTGKARDAVGAQLGVSGGTGSG